MPAITVIMEKNSARPPIHSAMPADGAIWRIALYWKMNQPKAKPAAYSNQNSCQN